MLYVILRGKDGAAFNGWGGGRPNWIPVITNGTIQAFIFQDRDAAESQMKRIEAVEPELAGFLLVPMSGRITP